MTVVKFLVRKELTNMNYEKYVLFLEGKYNNAFSLLKEIAMKRDNKLIEAFIDKALEEISFNDFYVSGNEDVLKYAGVIMGLEGKNHPFFQQLTRETKEKLVEVKQVSLQMTEGNDDLKILFNNFKEGAEYCLHDFIDEKLKYQNLNQKIKLEKILSEAKKIASNGNLTLNSIMEFKSVVEKGEELIDTIKQINDALENEIYVKKNAFYAIKKFNWLHEKGTFDNMTKIQKQVYLSKQQVKECRAKAELLFGGFPMLVTSDEKVSQGIA